ncbi:4Fe-4S cluster-binding domain-containing protein [uncultured Coprobacter sp.]|uniref:radical SAM protein n=1 Tax=uncultured Coprobacter sp. TaxID=1720550 RepID=UPI0025960362|nr:4Fe-4S cluster-binding domain-containing protein [uncultured Coprobacter sp.]
MNNITNNIWEEEHSSKRRVCMLMITHACNLKCSYCYETHKQNTYMTVDLAKQIISEEAEMIESSDKFDEIQIDFMGGEPLMNFTLIKEIVEWLEKGAINVPWVCFASTNATLINDDIKDWLKKHKKYMILGISYDGTSKMQSQNRGTDNYEIDLDFFYNLWPEQTFQMTISKETLPFLAEGVLSVQRKGYEINASLAQGINWTMEDAKLYREQLCLLKEAYLKDVKLRPFNRLTRYVDVFNLAPTERRQIHGCGSGLNMVTYDVDGKKYGCHMFTPIVLGTGAIGVNAIEWEKEDLMADPYCETCVLRRFCPTCPGFNYKFRGSFASRDKRWCPLVLAEAMTACEFQIERIAMINHLSAEDAEHAQTAIKAYNVLKHLDLEKSVSPYVI